MSPKLHSCCVLVAAALALVCSQLHDSNAQKTAQRWSSAGSNQQSVYGGYQPGPQSQPPPPQQQQQSYEQQRVAAPSQQRPRMSYQQSSSSASRTQQVARQPVYQQQQQQEQQQEASYEASGSSAEADAEPATYGAVNGQPGKDFPAYTRIPKTSFSCDGLPYDYGMYADEETGCQAYHLCYNGRKESFLCGVGTVFNQRILHCDYWYSVDCGQSSKYYSSNAYMGSSQPEPGPAEANAAPSVSKQSYNRQQTATAPRPASPNGYRQQESSNSFSRTSQQVQESY